MKSVQSQAGSQAGPLAPAGQSPAPRTSVAPGRRPLATAEGSQAAPGEVVELSFYNLLWIFALCSVGGLAVETLVSYPIDGVWKDRAGLVWGPFSPIYGVGGVLMTVFLNRTVGLSALAVFCRAALLGGGFELFAGWFWKNMFGIVAWSYADQPFNIGGYTCLGIAICWGAIGLAWVRVLLPRVAGAIDLLPVGVRGWLTAGMSAFLAVDVAMTMVAFNCWFERQAGLPVETPVQQLAAQQFGDQFMAERFETMSMYTDLADRG